MKTRLSSTKSGFTIVELLVVIVVIGILAAVTIVSYTGISQKAIAASLQSDLASASKQLKLDQVINSVYPARLDLANGGRGIPFCTGTTTCQYVYSNNTTPQGFCINATKDGQNYKITNTSIPVVGDCADFGLVMRLDAGNIASYPGTGITWTDLSGNGNNCTLMNGVAYSNTNGGVLVFDGVNDYVDCGINSALTPNDITVSAWVQASVLSGWSGIVSNMSAWGTGFGLQIGSSQNIAATISGLYLRTSWLPVVSTWYYITATHDYATNTNKIYVNAGLENSSTSAVSYSTNSRTEIGVFYTSPGLFLNGQLGDVRIYSRALSPTEISQNFNALKARYGL